MADRLQYLRIHSGLFTRSKKSLPREAWRKQNGGGRRMEKRKNSEWGEDTCIYGGQEHPLGLVPHLASSDKKLWGLETLIIQVLRTPSRPRRQGHISGTRA